MPDLIHREFGKPWGRRHWHDPIDAWIRRTPTKDEYVSSVPYAEASQKAADMNLKSRPTGHWNGGIVLPMNMADRSW
jgi:hypothetical protein